MEKDYLQSEYTCYTHSSSKDSNTNSNKELFAVGCANGSIIIWDIARGVVISALNSSSTPSNNSSSSGGTKRSKDSYTVPLDIVISTDQKRLFVCDGSDLIREYDIMKAKLITTTKRNQKTILTYVMPLGGSGIASLRSAC